MKNTLAKLMHKAPHVTEFKEMQAMRTALAYAGVAPENAKFDKVLRSTDALGTVYELEFQDLRADETRCSMAYCCYVDAFTGEVRGFLATLKGVPCIQVLRA